jgi:FkbM family methyltransferase
MGRLTKKVCIETGKHLSRHRNSFLSMFIFKNITVLRNHIENVNFDQKTNGEGRYLKELSSLNFNVIFDVGANIGEWALCANEIFPESKIHSFEILPKHWNDFTERTRNLSNIKLNQFGLSDFEGTIEVHFNSRTEADSMATIYPQFIMDSEKEHYDSKCECMVKKGSDYVLENNILSVDLMKIDVEGHELKVIRGFGDFIRNIRLIQFEYGVYNITSRDLLCDFFDYLEKYNFIIGRLYPHFVDFFKYDYSKESFLGGNYIAVDKNDKDILMHLSKF